MFLDGAHELAYSAEYSDGHYNTITIYVGHRHHMQVIVLISVVKTAFFGPQIHRHVALIPANCVQQLVSLLKLFCPFLYSDHNRTALSGAIPGDADFRETNEVDQNRELSE